MGNVEKPSIHMHTVHRRKSHGISRITARHVGRPPTTSPPTCPPLLHLSERQCIHVSAGRPFRRGPGAQFKIPTHNAHDSLRATFELLTRPLA